MVDLDGELLVVGTYANIEGFALLQRILLTLLLAPGSFGIGVENELKTGIIGLEQGAEVVLSEC